jgi:murein DD-endopeptidase MepM/ murein hydrolase activator NlpD
VNRVFVVLVSILWAGLLVTLTLAQEPLSTPTPIATAIPSDVTPTAIPKPPPAISLSQDGITVELFFESLKQGRAGVVRVDGPGVREVRAQVFGRIIEFFPVDGEGFYGLIAVGIEQTAREYDFEIYAVLADETRITIPARFAVSLGGFVLQEVELPPERAYLIDPLVERAEFARVASVFQNITQERLWDSGEVDWQFPLNAPLTSQFGALRVFNGTAETLHTGWDLRAETGTPIFASASGIVAFAGLMDIRGNLVIIDHGYGIFSGYAHFSQIHVVRGQEISKGQILGMSGNTGRSSGPHLHWEMNINGEWIDSVDFLQTWIPG